jgi:hypothetical protein
MKWPHNFRSDDRLLERYGKKHFPVNGFLQNHIRCYSLMSRAIVRVQKMTRVGWISQMAIKKMP